MITVSHEIVKKKHRNSTSVCIDKCDFAMLIQTWLSIVKPTSCIFAQRHNCSKNWTISISTESKHAQIPKMPNEAKNIVYYTLMRYRQKRWMTLVNHMMEKTPSQQNQIEIQMCWKISSLSFVRRNFQSKQQTKDSIIIPGFQVFFYLFCTCELVNWRKKAFRRNIYKSDENFNNYSDWFDKSSRIK